MSGRDLADNEPGQRNFPSGEVMEPKMKIENALNGKIALVTGAASGIGRATAQLFAAQGAKVVLADIREESLGYGEDAITARGGESISVRTDVGKIDDVDRMLQATFDRWGCPDVVFSNSASYTLGTASELSEDQWDSTVAICLKATWMIARRMLPAMAEKGSESFIVTSSVHAILGYKRHAAYQASKGGLNALTRSMAADYAPSVRVNTIMPGAVETGIWDGYGLTPADRARIAKQCPLQKNGQPDDTAWTALFLAYITGPGIVVDGGSSTVSGS
jgi:NAD(P)-dependent dehydrogenase (short-subunit alcohol dehydrogenase family)